MIVLLVLALRTLKAMQAGRPAGFSETGGRQELGGAANLPPLGPPPESVLLKNGQNIANAETPGYSRQRADLAAANPDALPPFGQIGRGVQVLDIARVRSAFYDTSWRREAGAQSQYQTLQRQLSQISGVLGEPSDSGRGVSLDNLIDAFNTLASNPVDPTARTVVVANATALANQFNRIDRRLQDINTQIGGELNQAILDANSYLDELNQLNTQLQSARAQAPDLLDRRDLLLDKLSQLVDTRTVDRGNGTVDVSLGGIQLVSVGGGVQHLAVTGGGPYQITYGNPAANANPASGQLKGLLDSSVALGTGTTPSARATGLRGQLDDLALGIVSAVNQIHRNYDPTNNPLQPTITPAPSPLRTIIPFFDSNGVTAATMAVNSAIVADPTQIAAGYSTAPGDESASQSGRAASGRHQRDAELTGRRSRRESGARRLLHEPGGGLRGADPGCRGESRRRDDAGRSDRNPAAGRLGRECRRGAGQAHRAPAGLRGRGSIDQGRRRHAPGVGQPRQVASGTDRQ